jgi:hypothetical protein
MYSYWKKADACKELQEAEVFSTAKNKFHLIDHFMSLPYPIVPTKWLSSVKVRRSWSFVGTTPKALHFHLAKHTNLSLIWESFNCKYLFFATYWYKWPSNRCQTRRRKVPHIWISFLNHNSPP